MNKKFLGFFSVLLISFMMFTNVHALNVVEAGETVIHEGEYDSTKLVAGNIVTDKASVNGLSFVAGNEVTLEGTSEYGFYAGNILTINENITKDAFIAGNSITIGKNATLGRDVYIAGNSITINANVTRDLRIGGSVVDLRGVTVGGNAYIDASEIILDKDTIINGKLQYIEEAQVKGLDVASVNEIKAVKAPEVKIEYNFKDRLFHFLESTFAALIVMLILFYLLPSSKKELDNLKIDFVGVCKNTLIGLALLIVVPVVAIIALFTGVLTPLALIVGVIYGISLYLASLLVYYLVGKYITTKLIKNDSIYLTLICGIVLVKLLEFVPYLGGFISLLSLLYGLALIFKFIKRKEN